MRIFVRTLSLRNVPIEVAPTDTIRTVKQKFYEAAHDIVPQEQKLLYQHQAMCDTCTVAEYDIHEGATLFVVNAIFERR